MKGWDEQMLTKENLIKEYESFFEHEKHTIKLMYLDVDKTMEDIGVRMEEGMERLHSVNQFLFQCGVRDEREKNREENRIIEEFSPLEQYHFYLDKELKVMTSREDLDDIREQAIREAANCEPENAWELRMKRKAEQSLNILDEMQDEKIEKELEDECMKACMEHTAQRSPNKSVELGLER